MIIYLIIVGIIFIPLSFMVDIGKLHPLLFALLFFPLSSPIIYKLVSL